MTREQEIEGLLENMAHGNKDEYFEQLGVLGCCARLKYLQDWAERLHNQKGVKNNETSIP